jgi:magnesium chelatase subunit H
MQLSPVFRDAFGILMNHLDNLIKDVAKASEPHDMNFIKKHVDEAIAKGATFESATSRLFTQSPGAYGTYVDDMIEDSAWESGDDLDNQFVRRNAFAYGGSRNGAKEGETLTSLLGTVSRVVHQVDSVEFGISDIDHYFSTSGALKLCAEKRNSKLSEVKLNYVESFTADTKIDDVGKALKIEYRTKLLNPKWYEGMMSHGTSGAAEISNRFTYMLGWDATTKSVDDWVYTKAAETYALDESMRERLAKANPQAMKNIVGRLLEASGRGLWKADADMLDQLKELYADLEDRLEGVVK